ncbi:hypothetical protein [Eisenbergiella porci]|uniref:hypothetical protein n=1 Tax=Eisenbergiella porci TaxID=2652274 RepID=UPI002A814F8F|nr:hypothetical protein [Eisenbergiella porci]
MANRKMESAEKLTIEEWRIAHKIPMAIHYGLCTRKGWKRGKVVTETEYRQAMEDFMEGGKQDVKGC